MYYYQWDDDMGVFRIFTPKHKYLDYRYYEHEAIRECRQLNKG